MKLSKGSMASGAFDSFRMGTEMDLARSISGPDLVAIMRLPGFGIKVFAEMQTISYSTHRDTAAVPANGSVSPRGVVRGTRTVAGSLIFVQFDRDALMEILDFYRRPGHWMGRYSALMHQTEWAKLSQKIGILAARLRNVRAFDEAQKNNQQTPSNAGASDQKFAIDTYNNFSPTTAYKDANGVAYQQVVNDETAMGHELDRLEDEYLRSLKVLRTATRTNPIMANFRGNIQADSLPPFDIILYGANEAGVMVRGGVYGIRIVTSGATLSVQDLVVEQVYTYMARKVDPIDSMPHPSITDPSTKLGITYLQKQVENMENELQGRLTFMRDFRKQREDARNTLRRRGSLRVSKYAYGFDYGITFLGGMQATVNLITGKVLVSFNSQTQHNTPPINPLFPGSGVISYQLTLHGGEFAPRSEEVDASFVGSIRSVTGEKIGIATQTIVMNPTTEVTADDYEILIDKSKIRQVIEASSPRIRQENIYRLQVSFKAKVPYTETIDDEDEAKAYEEFPEPPASQLRERTSNTISSIKKGDWVFS